MELSKDEKAYLKLLEGKRDGLARQINRLSHERQEIVQEIIKVQSGNSEFHQTSIKWEEV